MLNFKNFKQIFLVLIASSIIFFQIKPMEEITPQKLDIGICSHQGPRRYMEDEYQIIKNWGNTGITYAAIFDGHGGNKVAKYLKDNLHVRIFQIYELQQVKNLKEAIRLGCAQINQDIFKNTEINKQGSCAVIAFILENKIIIANIGDSRAVLSNNGIAIQLSTDHKPNEIAEKARIEAAGGKVCIARGGIPRIGCCFGLAISRAFGDIDYAESGYVISKPQITEHNLPANSNDILILACDGLWDVMQNQEVVDFVAKQNKYKNNMQQVSEELVKEAILVRRTHDNITVITIKLPNPTSSHTHE